MLRPELRDYFEHEVDKLRKQHGDFILINTNFQQRQRICPQPESVPSRENTRCGANVCPWCRGHESEICRRAS